MNEIIKKLTEISNEISSEKTDGSLRMLCLLSRADLVNKWDILVCADWVKKSRSEDDLIYLIEKLKAKFDKFDFLSNIVLLPPKEPFAVQLARALSREQVREGVEYENLIITADFSVHKIILIRSNFEEFDFESEANLYEQEPIISEDANNF